MRIYYKTNFRTAFSYIEVLLASIIIAIMLVSGLKLSANLGRSQQDVVSSSTADLLALNMIEEIKQYPYEDQYLFGNFGREAGESATTREFFRKKLVDNIYDSSPLLATMLNDASIREYQRGGRKIVEPLLYAKNTALGVYSNFDTFDMTPPDNITAAEQVWGHYYVTIAISGDDETDNMGESQVLSLISERTREAEMALKDKVTDDIYAGSDTKGIIGLSTAIAAGTYGGIAGATLN